MCFDGLYFRWICEILNMAKEGMLITIKKPCYPTNIHNPAVVQNQKYSISANGMFFRVIHFKKKDIPP